MTKSEVIEYLENYARSFSAPVHLGVSVKSVSRDLSGLCVRTNAGEWRTRNVVIATGHCDRSDVPVIASALSPDIDQVVPTSYRRPEQLREGGVLVVGASATGIQLASEIARSGRLVTLAVGRHTRLPRRYRGRDIMAWLDAMGVLTETAEQVWDLAASRAQTSLQLEGSDDHRSLDLDMLRARGVRLVGRMIGAYQHRAYFANDLADSVQHADAKMHEQLDRVDRYIERMRLGADFPAEDRPHLVHAPTTPFMLGLATEGIHTVLWATGYRREYPWLNVPVLDARREIVHTGGVTAQPGLYALGLHFMRRRNSSFLDGVGADAADLADHIAHRMSHRSLAVA